MSALAKIKDAGFEIWLKDNGNLGVKPFNRLTNEQMAFLKAHKAEIIKALASKEAVPSKAEAIPVICFTPNGNPITVQADDPDHATWLKRMNPPPSKTIVMSDTRNVHLTGQEAETAIVRWLHWIGENNADLINEVLDKCRTDPAALNYYLKRSGEVGNPPPPGYGFGTFEYTTKEQTP